MNGQRKGSSELKIQELSFSYGRNHVLEDVTLRLAAGESVGLIGENGAGKSTLLRLLVGLEAGFSGSICVCGMPMEKKNLEDIRAAVGYVFQDSDSQLFMTTVYEDVAFAPQNYGYDDAAERAVKAMEQVHILHLRDQSVYKLSGGEKKLASIATILSMSPELLLLDEPSAALDPSNRRNVIRVIQSLPQTKLIASHDLDFIWDTCSRCVILHQGRIAADGPSESVLRDKALLERCGLELPLSLQGR